MRRTVLLPLLVVLALVAGACAGDSAALPLERAERTTTTPATDAHPAEPEGPTAEQPGTEPEVAEPVGQAPVADPGAGALVTPAGYVLPVLGREGDAWRVLTPCSNEALVVGGTPLRSADVVLDPGHGGSETGAVGYNGLREADLNWFVTQHTKAALEEAGYTVVLTRTGDYRITLLARAQIAVRLGARAFVSIHYNGGPELHRDTPGTEVYHQHGVPESKRLGGLLYEEIYADLARYEGMVWGSARDAGNKYRLNSRGGDFYGILRHAGGWHDIVDETPGVPAALTEGAYLSEAPEADLLARPEVQRDQGLAIARAIIRFLETDDPGSGHIEPLFPHRPAGGPGGGASGCVDPQL